MTEQMKSVLDDEDNLELITSWLNGHLDQDRVEAVRKRLEEDASFRDLAAPLILTWSVPKHLERVPRPEGEWERDWSEFAKRVSFDETHPARPKRRRWPQLLGLAFVLGILWDVVVREPSGPAREYSVVPYDTGWISLNDGVEVQLSPGALLKVDHRLMDGMRHVLLEGTAQFRLWPRDSAEPILVNPWLRVETRAGNVTAREAEFTVTARADTTFVQVHPFNRVRSQLVVMPVVASTVLASDRSSSLPLRELDGALLVRGRDPQRITTTNNR